MSDHEITVTLKADANGCLSVIKQVTRSVDELSGKKVGNAGMPDLGKGAKQAAQGMREAKSETDALASSIGKLKGMIAGAFTLGAITSFGKKALEASANMEVFKKGLSFTLGSEGEADKLIASMQQIGEASAYDTTQLLPLARQWVNIGNSADEASSKMKKIVDLGSAYGMQTEQIQAANLALTQMSMAGKIGAQDMMQLINAGVPAWQLLADKMGLSVAQVRDLSQQGALGEEAINTLWDAITEKTQGAADTMGNTLMAKFSNMEESITNSMSGIGDIISQALDLPDVLTQVGAFTESFKQHIFSIRDAAKQIGVKDAILNEIEQINPTAGAAAKGAVKAFEDIKKAVTDNAEAIKIATEAVVVFSATTAVLTHLHAIIGALELAYVAVGVAILTAKDMAVAFNAVALSNPWALAIAAIITVLVLCYNHWDLVKQKAEEFGNACLEACETAGNAIREHIGEAIKWAKGLWEDFKEACSHPIDFVVNKIIRGSNDAPGVMPDGYAQGGVFGSFATGGVVGGRIPALANGGQLKHGTPAIVGEAGPEAVIPLKKGVLGNIGNSIVDSSGLPQTAADLIKNAVDQAMAGAASMNANKKNPVYTAERSFSKASKPEDSDAYTKVLDKMKQKILDIDEAQEKFHQEWQRTAEEAAKYADGGEKTLRYQKQLQSNQEQIAKLQEKISSGKGDGSEAGQLDSLVQQGKNLTAKYEKEKAEALAAAQATQDGITQIDADAEAARMKAKQDALDQMGSYETQLAQAQYAQKKAMMATELDDFLAQMTAKDEITGQSYATTLANEQYLAEQRRVWMDELMLASVSWGEYMQTMLTNMAVQVQDGIASGIAQCVVEGKKFSQVMSNLGKTLLKQLIQGVIQKVISGWIMAIGLGNNRHKQEMKNTAAETEAAGAKATVLASAATAAVIAANPAGAAGAAALVSGQMGEAATAAGLIVKAAQAVFKGKNGGLSAGDTESGGQETVTKPTGPAIQIGDTSLLEKFPALANGGVVTGPTAALIGEGRYDEAVLPLKPSLLEKLFGSGESRQTTVVANQNIYGDINTREDDEDMFGGFNDLVLAGLRGA